MNIDIERIIAACEDAEKTRLPENMVLIPAGEFQMGSDKGAKNEKPVHSVYVDAFYMDVYQVTLGQYRTFLHATGHGDLPKVTMADVKRFCPTEQHPVVSVTWLDAMAYAQWAGKRLPTEAEWEKAARGGLVGKTYPWGNAIDRSKANYRHRHFSLPKPTPVGSYSANGYGLYDMAGNVWEWCLDAYEKDFYMRSPRENPLAGEMSLSEVVADYRNIKTSRVLRGGCFNVAADNLRVAQRVRLPAHRHRATVYFHGFRCVQSVTP